MKRDELIKVLENHKKWTENNGGRCADLRCANLCGADLCGADLDFSCWPLWCGSLGVKIDKRVFTQLIYHICRTVVDDDECKAIQSSLADFANGFHRADECGKIKKEQIND